MMTSESRLDAVVVGAGQAGLATSYHLTRNGVAHVVLERDARIGEVWHSRWDSLHLFTPARHDGLPGMPFPGSANTFPAKEDVASYLTDYSARFELPVRFNTAVTRVAADGAGFELHTGNGLIRATSVIVASGPNSTPWIPEFGMPMSRDIHQLHTADYRNPEDIPAGPVLVVGAGTSGVAVALELAQSHEVTIAGRPTAQIPNRVLRYLGGPYWAFINSVLTTSTPIGRKVAGKFHDRGAPLLGAGVDDLDRAGVARRPRLAQVVDGAPVLEDGSAPAVTTIVWATGYRPEFTWIDDLVVTDKGWPATRRGVVANGSGLYFVGMPFQYGLTSGLLGGVGRDAAHVVAHLVSRQRIGRSAAGVAASI